MSQPDPRAPATVEHDTPKPSDGYVQSFARGLEVLRSFGGFNHLKAA